MHPSPKMVKAANARFHAGLRLYNACLAEALRRSTQVKGDPTYEMAKALSRGKLGSPERKARSLGFHAIDDATASMSPPSCRTPPDCDAASSASRSSPRKPRSSDAGPCAVHDHHVGLRGRPRFKPARRGLRSLEAKDGRGALQPVINREGHLKSLRWGSSPSPSHTRRPGRSGKRWLALRLSSQKASSSPAASCAQPSAGVFPSVPSSFWTAHRPSATRWGPRTR